MTGRWVWPVVDAALNAVADGIDLAAKTLCPMDHTPPPNLLDDQSLYVRIPEPRLTDDELAAVRSIIADRNSKAIAEPSRAEGTQRADSSGEVGGHESPSPERPAEPASTEDVAACIKSFLEDQVDGEIDWMTRIFIDGASDVIAEGLSPHFSFTRK